MSSIGPELPPHLQKRKRTPEEDDSPESPPSKALRRTNNDEIALDDDSSEDEYGPSAGPAQPTSTNASQQGPSLPPPSANNKPDREQPSTGPSIGPSMPPPSHTQTYGPTPPPASLDTRPTTNPNNSDSDSDDDYGPSLPSSNTPQTSLFDQPTTSSSGPTAPKRDDWMLAPPTSSGPKAPDPTKLKSRGFASGRSAAASQGSGGGISSIWTETPEEKAKRLRDAVLGRGDVTQVDVGREGARGTGGGGRTAADEERIRQFTEQTRGRSLVEEHRLKKEAEKRRKGQDGMEEEEDDPSKRAFDWEKDMKAAGGISHTQRRELLSKSGRS
ncbi:hypothetical protein DL546_006472 [Coniochaeta pulveracea]|uniref:DUF3752 domain-containing protein n=1 Tax=Coniochaeta pulveracea TaxID=177199 RepID=A0A420YK59_9PEZI|nr:hypothetical protein DL546_006472 [Coniochaeta pulveracea]